MSMILLSSKLKFLFGFHDGQISSLDLNMQVPNNSIFSSKTLINEGILFMTEIFDNSKILIITPSALKILNGNYFKRYKKQKLLIIIFNFIKFIIKLPTLN